MTYTDHYEIQFKIVGEWQHASNIYPKYTWKIIRPWYFLGLVRHERLAKGAQAADAAAWVDACVAAQEFAYGEWPYCPYRVWQWRRRGGWFGRWFGRKLSRTITKQWEAT